MAFGAELSLEGFFRSLSTPQVQSRNTLRLRWKYCRRVFLRSQNIILPPTEDEQLGPSRFYQSTFSLLVFSEFRRQIWITLQQLDFPPSLCNFLYHNITSYAVDFAVNRRTLICPPMLIVAEINIVQRLYVDGTPWPLRFIQQRRLDESLILETSTEGPEAEINAVVDETSILGGLMEELDGSEIDSRTFYEAFVLGIPADEAINPGTSTEEREDTDMENNSRSEMLKRGRRGKWVIEGGEETACSVCLEELCEGVEVMTMECEHVFHQECILTWLNQKQTCPLCRRQI